MSNEHTIEQSAFESQIHKMAVTYADSKFKRDSFRWQHMVRIYKDAILEYVAFQLMNFPGNHEAIGMPLPLNDPFNQSTTND